MEYPLQLHFKILAVAPQISVQDAQGTPICYVKQKLLKLKENIQIFTDKTKTTQIASIQANKIIDWSARYYFTDQAGKEVGSVGRRGMRSLWKARYDVFNPGDSQSDFKIEEENGWIKLIDGFVGEIPVLGMFTGYILNPAYLATRSDGTPVMRLVKRPAFFEGKFHIEKLGELTPLEELNLIYSFLMLVLLERNRG